MQPVASQATISKFSRYVARRDLGPRDGGIPLMISVDSRVDNESPPNQNGAVDWPLRHMVNEGNSEYRNHKTKKR